MLRETLTFRYPADAVLAHALRRHRDLHSTERRLVGEAVFGALRRKRTLGALAGEADRQLIAAAIARHPRLGPDALAPVLDAAGLEAAKQIATAAAPTSPAAVAGNLPDWLYETLVDALGAEEAREAAAALARPAPLDLRVNPLRVERGIGLDRLQRDGYKAEACRYSPLGIRVRERPSLRQHPLMRSGAFEIQDEGSQLIGLLVDGRPGEMIADYCAGAGGKTLLIGAAMKSSGRLYAFDVVAKRLERIRPRLKRSGLSNVMPVPISGAADGRLHKLRGKMDRVLVDAPCTGVGTVRRNPDLKWKHAPDAVTELAAKQGEIMASAARLVKPGGRLVYATCSWLAGENQEVVAAFLDAHPDYRLVPATPLLASMGVVIDAGGEFLQLWPHRHGTDGFFAAVLERAG